MDFIILQQYFSIASGLIIQSSLYDVICSCFLLQFSIQNLNQSNLPSPVTEDSPTLTQLNQNRTMSFASDVTESDFSAASIIGDDEDDTDDDKISLTTTSSHHSNTLGICEDNEENVDGFYLLCFFVCFFPLNIKIYIRIFPFYSRFTLPSRTSADDERISTEICKRATYMFKETKILV